MMGKQLEVEQLQFDLPHAGNGADSLRRVLEIGDRWPNGVAPEATILEGDALEILPTVSAETVDCACTSPPYGLRSYAAAALPDARLPAGRSGARPVRRHGYDAPRRARARARLHRDRQ
jgi:hypothetical protein